jgi:hypothetical protein
MPMPSERTARGICRAAESSGTGNLNMTYPNLSSLVVHYVDLSGALCVAFFGARISIDCT